MEQNPNFIPTPIFIGEELVWLPAIEYYARHIGSIAIGETNNGMEVTEEN